MKPNRALTHPFPFVCALLVVAMLVIQPLPAYASLIDDLAEQQERLMAYEREHGVGSGRDWLEAQWRNEGIGLAAQASDEPMPAKFDLRERGVVTPVKRQDPWGSCWAFGAIAASETSILSDLGTTYDESPIDLSERHLAWYSGTALPDAQTMKSQPTMAGFASQAGEGVTPLQTVVNPTRSPFNTGGSAFYATTIFASGVGPLSEEQAPYQNEENIADFDVDNIDPSEVKRKFFIYNTPVDPDSEENEPYNLFLPLKEGADLDHPTDDDVVGRSPRQKKVDDELAKSGTVGYYSMRPAFDENGFFVCAENDNLRDYDWGLPHDKRFAIGAELEESTSLPSPAAADENGVYSYDASATEAIKRELMAGRGVQIELHADQSLPGQELKEDAYLNPNTWSHYSYDTSGKGMKVSLNHDVCIVGWDDDWGVENFNQGTYVNPDGVAVNRFPPAPGAWIVKNSWGAKGRGFPNESDWGVDGTGYFYLSYYDMSLTRPNTFDFFTEGLFSGRDEVYVNQYDFLPCYDAKNLLYSNEVSVANVFVAGGDQLVRTLSVETSIPNSHVKLSLYRLHGTAAESAESALTASADGAVTDPTDGDLVETIEADYPYGGYHRLQLAKSHYMANGQPFSVVCTMTVNTAEGTQYIMPTRSWYNENAVGQPDLGKLSIVGNGVVNEGESFVVDEGVWTDWSAMVASLKAQPGNLMDYDNFSLKAFADVSVPFAVTKEVLDAREVYYPGDEVRYRVSVKNVGDEELKNVVLADSLVDLGTNGSIASLPAGEEKSVEYTYKVTDEDAKRGSVTNSATASLQNVEGLNVAAETTVACASVQQPAPEQESSASTSSTVVYSNEGRQVTTHTTQTLPDTGDESAASASVALGVVAFGMLALARRLRRQ